MTPTKIVLEIKDGRAMKRVYAKGTATGSTVIEAVPLNPDPTRRGACLATMRKSAARYAKQFGVPFVDLTA